MGVAVPLCGFPRDRRRKGLASPAVWIASLQTALFFHAFSWAADLSKPDPGAAAVPFSLEQINTLELEPAVRDQITRAYAGVREHARDASAIGQLGMVLQVYGKYDFAEVCFQQARELDPRSFRWIYYTGNIEGILGKHAQAVNSIREALKIDGGYDPARVRLAGLLFESGETEQSILLYREAIRRRPDLAPAYLGLGQVLSARGQWTEALAAYRRACDLAPNYAAAHYSLAMAYKKTGDERGAHAQLLLHEQTKRSKQPSFDPLMDEVQSLYSGGLMHLSQASSLLQSGKLREAAAEFEAALEKNSRLMAARINLIALYGQLGEPEKSTHHFQQAIEMDPGWAEAYYNRGMFLRDSGESAKAAEAFTKALERNPHYADAHVQLAMLLDQAGDRARAAEHLELALRSEPGHRQAHFVYADHLVREGRFEAAIAHLRQTIAVEDERTPNCLYLLAAVYGQMGNRERAEHYFREALRRADTLGMRELASRIRADLSRLGLDTARH